MTKPFVIPKQLSTCLHSGLIRLLVFKHNHVVTGHCRPYTIRMDENLAKNSGLSSVRSSVLVIRSAHFRAPKA